MKIEKKTLRKKTSTAVGIKHEEFRTDVPEIAVDGFHLFCLFSPLH